MSVKDAQEAAKLGRDVFTRMLHANREARAAEREQQEAAHNGPAAKERKSKGILKGEALYNERHNIKNEGK